MSYQEFRPRQFQQLPMVVKNILIINVVLFVAKFLLNETIDLGCYLDLYPIGSTNFKPHQFITYMFMHADFWHVLFNMLWLFWMGQIFEEFLGNKRLLGLYLLGGLAGGVVFIAGYNLFPLFSQSNALLNSNIVAPLPRSYASRSCNFHSPELPLYSNEKTCRCWSFWWS